MLEKCFEAFIVCAPSIHPPGFSKAEEGHMQFFNCPVMMSGTIVVVARTVAVTIGQPSMELDGLFKMAIANIPPKAALGDWYQE
jgi:hypothetical protein